MKNRRIVKILGITLAAAILFQTATITYASIFGENNGDSVDISNVDVSQEIQDIIRQQDISSFNKNLTEYKRMIVLLDIHDSFKSQIESLISQGKKITDLMVAYNFLNDCYGTIDQLEPMVNKKEGGQAWGDIFTQYNRQNPSFEPRNFDFDYLDELAKKDGVTTDDIMIGDRISQQSGLPFEEVMERKMDGHIWKDINAELGIVNAQHSMPHVPVTPEQLKKYTADGRLSADLVVQTLVTAYKLGVDETQAINKAKTGYTTEMFFSEALERKYY